mmetsp:Transcript_67394/g.132956  ORF Transcript_67394/g.132956 Transcript_67394/m.132956 type:complete len:335 (+) Transcript_67394:418-1422(+)
MGHGSLVSSLPSLQRLLAMALGHGQHCNHHPNPIPCVLLRWHQCCCQRSLLLPRQLCPAAGAAAPHCECWQRVHAVQHLPATILAPVRVPMPLSTLGHPRCFPSSHPGKTSNQFCWSSCPNSASSSVNSSPVYSRKSQTSCSCCPNYHASANRRLHCSSCCHAGHCSSHWPCSKEPVRSLRRRQQLHLPLLLRWATPRLPPPHHCLPNHCVCFDVCPSLAFPCLCPSLFAHWIGSFCGRRARCQHCSCHAPRRSHLVHAVPAPPGPAQPPRPHWASQGWLVVPPPSRPWSSTKAASTRGLAPLSPSGLVRVPRASLLTQSRQGSLAVLLARRCS